MKVLIYALSTSILFSVSTFAQRVSVSVLDNNKEPVPNVIVYLTPTKLADSLPVNDQQVVIDQYDKKFAPYIAVMQKGQQIDFNNKDDITHHIYSVSGENNFEFKIKAGQSKKTQQLNAAEEVAMGCNIHDWMSGYILVVDTPYYAHTNAKGVAQLDLQTQGQYQLTVWHPQLDVKSNRIEQLIDVKFDVDHSSHWDVTLPSMLLPIPSQENQDDFDFLEEY